jgi:hypothetical protein
MADDYRWLVKLCKRFSLAKSSSGTYATAHKLFLDFCTAFHIEPLAVDEEELCMVVVHFVLGHTVTSTRSFLSALQKLFDNSGAGALPRSPGFNVFLRGIIRLFGPSDEVVRTRALGVEELHRILSALDPSVPEEACFGAQIVVAFFLALRTEDHTNGRLRWGDIYLQQDGSVEILLSPGKSVRRFRRTAIAAKTGVLSANYWLRQHAAHLPPGAGPLAFNTPVFVYASVARDGSTSWKPQSAGTFIKRFKTVVQSVLQCSPSLYSGYSLRRGGVTEMLSSNVPIAIIKAHVGWVASSNAHCTYYDHAGRLQMRLPTMAMGRNLV